MYRQHISLSARKYTIYLLWGEGDFLGEEAGVAASASLTSVFPSNFCQSLSNSSLKDLSSAGARFVIVTFSQLEVTAALVQFCDHRGKAQGEGGRERERGGGEKTSVGCKANIGDTAIKDGRVGSP